MITVKKSQNSIFVHLLTAFYSVGTWIGINGILSQLPLIISTAPEGLSLPSTTIVITQLGNIGPLFYTLYQKYARKKIKDAYVIYVIQAIAAVSALYAAFQVRNTELFAGQQRSISLFIIAFLMSLKANTSSVVCMPYMGRFVERYLASYMIGEGLSGLIPCLVSLIQGAGGEVQCLPTNSSQNDGLITSSFTQYTPPPLFSPEEFFIFIFVMILLSGICFQLLEHLAISKRQHAEALVGYGNSYKYKMQSEDKINGSNGLNVIKTHKLPKTVYFYVLFQMCFVGCIAVLYSIQSYSCLPYGSNAYHFAATLSIGSQPIMGFLATFLKKPTVRTIAITSGITIITAIFNIATAVMSPLPPLAGSTIGQVLIVFTWLLMMSSNAFCKISITSVMRDQGGKSLVLTGTFFLIGAALMSVTTFLLVNFSSVFTNVDPCS